MDTVTGPISESTAARIRREDAARRAAGASPFGAPPFGESPFGASAFGAPPRGETARPDNSRSDNARGAAARGGSARGASVRGGSHRAGPSRTSARTRIAIASTASIAGLSALVTGMTLPPDSNNDTGGPAVEAASLPGGFDAASDQASRSDTRDDPAAAPQVAVPPAPSTYDGEQATPQDPAGDEPYTGGAYSDDLYGTGYGDDLPSTGDVVAAPVPVVPLTGSTGQDGGQPSTDLSPSPTFTTPSGTSGDTAPPPWTPPYTPPAATPPTTTQQPWWVPTIPTFTPTNPPSTPPSDSDPTPPSATPSTPAPDQPVDPPPATEPSQPATEPASPAPSGTALPFDPEFESPASVPIFGLTPTDTPA